MTLSDILSKERVRVMTGAAPLPTKDAVLRALAELLGTASETPQQVGAAGLYRVLYDRETLQSTGIGDGVAIPHGSVEGLTGPVAAVLVCPDGVSFDAIDGRPVRILFAVVGPKRATGEHLKTLARISRLLRDSAFRDKLLMATTPDEAFALIRSAEEGRSA